MLGIDEDVLGAEVIVDEAHLGRERRGERGIPQQPRHRLGHEPEKPGVAPDETDRLLEALAAALPLRAEARRERALGRDRMDRAQGRAQLPRERRGRGHAGVGRGDARHPAVAEEAVGEVLARLPAQGDAGHA